jgi:hypothetical protein
MKSTSRILAYACCQTLNGVFVGCLQFFNIYGRRPFCGSPACCLGGDDPTIGGIAREWEIDMNKVDDRRVRNTKMVLKESFVRLLGEKDISEITIKEICDGADITGRIYAHYSNQ